MATSRSPDQVNSPDATVGLAQADEVVEPELDALIRWRSRWQIEQRHHVGRPHALAHVQQVAVGLIGEELHQGDRAERHEDRERDGQ